MKDDDAVVREDVEHVPHAEAWVGQTQHVDAQLCGGAHVGSLAQVKPAAYEHLAQAQSASPGQGGVS